MSEISPFPIRSWAEDDRPREKLLAKGSLSLTDGELLAILIGSGSRNESAVALAKRMLSSSGNSLQAFGKMSVRQLTAFKGIGGAKAVTIAAAMELGRRRREEARPELSRISSSQSVFDIMQPVIGELVHEEFWVIYMNNSNKIIYKAQLSKGGITGTVVDVRIAFKTAIEHNATAMILCHNHPSGTLTASDADRQITKKMKLAGENLDIRILDHVIITETSYMSFADAGIL